MRDMIDAPTRERFDLYLREIEHNGEAQGVLAVRTRSGERRLWEYHNTLRRTGTGRPVVWGIAHDVTERVQAETAVQASNDKLLRLTREQDEIIKGLTLFRNLLNQSTDAIQVVDPVTRRFLDVNDRACEALGYTREELLTMTVPDIDLEMDGSQCLKLQSQQSPASITIERTHRRKDGTTFPVEISLRRVRLDREYCVAVTRDITERKRAAQLLEESEKRFRAVYEKSPLGICVVDTSTGRFLHANPKYCEITGRTEQDLLSRDFYSITHPADLAENRINATQLVKGEIPSYDIEKRYVLPDGSIRWVHATAVSVVGDSTGTSQSIAIVQDITERRQADEDLRASDERLRLALKVAKIGMFERNLKTGESLWSPETEAMHGLAPGTFPKSIAAFLELVHEEDRPRVARLVEQSMTEGEVEGEWRVPWPSGRWRVFKDAEGKPARIIGMDSDVTERKQTEEALRQSEERFRVALKNSPIAVFNQDRDLRYTWMYNPQLSRPASELVGKTPFEFFGREDYERITEARRRVLETGVGMRDEIQFMDQGRKRYLDTTIEPLRDATGTVIGLTGSNMDVTELRETTEALRQAKERLAEEKLYLEQEIDTELGFEEIIGQSKRAEGRDGGRW